MNHPWLTTIDCPVSALLRAPAKNRTASATSSVVTNSPSTVLLQHHVFDHVSFADAEVHRLLGDLLVDQ